MRRLNLFIITLMLAGSAKSSAQATPPLTVGCIVGGIIGATHSGERWERVAPDHWYLSLAPRLDGDLALAVSIPF